MRKYINISLSVFALIGISFTSCKKSFLEIVPKGKLVPTTYSDFDLLMNGSNFYNYGYGGGWALAAVMGDEVGAEESVFNSYYGTPQSKASFRYEDAAFVGAEQPLWMRPFTENIFSANLIIEGVPTATEGTPQQKLALKSEAMVTRAFINFQMINFFGKPYNASTSSTDPGYPIVTGTDVTKTDFVRTPVKDVYDFIVKEMLEAIPNLRTQPPVATRWSKAAGEAFLGKVYLFMGKYTEALAMFNASFNDIGTMTKPPRLYDYNETFAPPGGSFLPIDSYSGPNSPFTDLSDLTESVQANIYYSKFGGNVFGNDYLVLTGKAQGLYSASDWRLKFYTSTRTDGSAIPGGRLRKYGIDYRAGVQLPELYLMRAEVKARANDLAGAKADLETLRKKRIAGADALVPAAVAANQTALIKYIIDERTREFAGEGYRWLDMRRLSVDPLFTSEPLAPHKLYLTSGDSTLYPLKAVRLTLQLPQSYLDQHPEMPNNP